MAAQSNGGAGRSRGGNPPPVSRCFLYQHRRMEDAGLRSSSRRGIGGALAACFTAMNDSAPVNIAVPSLGERVTVAWNGDLAWSFRHSPVAIPSAIVLAICLVA